MAQSLEAFEQMTAEWLPTERTPPRVFAFESPLCDYRSFLKFHIPSLTIQTRTADSQIPRHPVGGR